MNRQLKYEENLYEYYSKASTQNIQDGMHWYYKAHHSCETYARHLNMPLYKFVAIVAALSPQKKWENNIKDAIKFILSGGKCKLFATNVMKNKCFKIMHLENDKEVLKILNGNKIKNFYLNILKPYKSGGVTVDRHVMTSVGMQGSLTNKKYKEISNVHRKVSEKIGIKAHELQAIVWLVVR